MPIVFAQINTKLIVGTYFSTNNLEITEGEIPKKYETSLHNSMKVLSQQNNTKLQFVHSMLGGDFNLMIICKKDAEDNIRFSLINNPVFKSRAAYDFLVQNLQKFAEVKEAELLTNPMNLLNDIERQFYDIVPDDYLNYMPLLSNYLFEVIYNEIKEKDSKSLKQLIEFQPESTYSKIHDIFLEENARNSDEVLNRTEAFKICPSPNGVKLDQTYELGECECLRLYFNLLILSMRLNEPIAFRTIYQHKIDERINLVKDKYASFTNLLIANWFLVDDVKKAHSYLIEVNENIIPYLSIKAKINYLRLKGAIHERSRDYSESLESYLSAVSLLDNLDNLSPSAGLAYAGMGNIYGITGQHMRAITAYSFAASLFDYLSLEKQQNSMLNNILTIRTLKAKDYLSAGLVSINNERYKEADEYIERAVQEFALLLIETQPDNLMNSVQEVSSVLNPLVLRKEVDKNLEIMMEQSLKNVDILLSICSELRNDGNRDENIFGLLRTLAAPRKLKVHQVILIHHDGRYITSLSSEDKLAEKDKSMIFAGAMTAIQLLLKEVIHSEKIHTIDAGENQILLRKAESIQIVIIVNKVTEEIITAADVLIDAIEEKYGKLLDDWDGSLAELRNTTNLMKEFIYDRINE